MSRSMLSNSKLIKWSEPVTILGRGVPNFSRKYRCLSYCIAGVGNKSDWLRLYPLLFKNEDTRVNNFDIIKVKIRDGKPEKLRPESRKVCLYPSFKKINRISDEITRIKLLENYTDSGEFLHNESWRGIKTLGLIQPLYPEFEISGNKVIVKYKCNASHCRGHITEIPSYTMEDYQITEYINTDPGLLEKQLLLLKREVLLQRKKLWFVMGTHALHPSKWILIEAHITNNINNKEVK